MKREIPKPIVAAIGYLFEAPRLIVGVSFLLFGLDMLVAATSRLRPGGMQILASVVVLRLICRAWMRPGYLRALEEARRGYAITLDALGSGTDRFGSMLVTIIVGDAIIGVSLLVGALPGTLLALGAAEKDAHWLVLPGLALAAIGAFGFYLYAWLGVRFAEHLVALEQRSPLAALARSWKLAQGRRARIFAVSFFAATIELFALVWGVFSFGAGMFVSVPYARVVGDHALLTELATACAALKQSEPAPIPPAFVPA